MLHPLHSGRGRPLRVTALALGLAVAGLAAGAASAADSLDAHVHGQSALDIAIDGKQMVVSLRMPGADAVGFEREARSSAEKAAVTKAKKTLGAQDKIFVIPAAAKCKLTKASVEIEGGDDHDGHDHDDHADHDDHDHGKKKKAKKTGGHDHDHDHDHGKKKKTAKQDDHDHDHDHGHDHDKKAEAADDGHNEFHADYAFTCAAPDNLDTLTVNLFKHFPRAEEVKASIVGPAGQYQQTLTPKSVSLAMRPS
ncbi:MAG: DUF2796 domain-containing protein [Pseudomonadota bacterium]